MINGRVALFRLTQDFFERELRGYYRWDSVSHLVAEPAEKLPGRSKYAYGKIKEIIAIQFGDDYRMTVRSSLEEPPLGRVTLAHGKDIVDGPLDARTWAKIGAAIRSERDHG